MQFIIQNNLRAHRKAKGLRQIDVAIKLGFCTTERISRWEKGISYPSIFNLYKLAKIYGVPTDVLYQEVPPALIP